MFPAPCGERQKPKKCLLGKLLKKNLFKGDGKMNGTKLGKKEYVSPALQTQRFDEKDIITTSGTKLSWGTTWGNQWGYFTDNEGGNE